MSGGRRVSLRGVISQGSSVSKEGNLVWLGYGLFLYVIDGFYLPICVKIGMVV